MSLQQVAALGATARGLVNSFDRSALSGIEQQILDAAGSSSIGRTMGSLDAASNASGRSFDAAEGIYNRQIRGLGQTLDDDQARAAKRRIGLSRALSSVDARNREVTNLRGQRDMARSSAGSLRDIIEGNILEARGTAAQMEGQREVDYQQARAEYAQRRSAGLGNLVGLGAMFIPGVGPMMAASGALR